MPCKSLSSSTVPIPTFGVPYEFSAAPIIKGSISLSYHSVKSPSAAKAVGGFKDIVGTPLAPLVIELADAPAGPTLLEASLHATA